MKALDVDYWFLGLVFALIFSSVFFVGETLSYVGSVFLVVFLFIYSLFYTARYNFSASGSIYFCFLFSVLIYMLGSALVLSLYYNELSIANIFDSIYMPGLLLAAYLLFRSRRDLIDLVLVLVLVTALYAAYMLYLERSSALNMDIMRQNNWGNVIGASLPFAFLVRKRFITFLLLLLGSLIVIYGLKRSGMIVAVSMFIIYFLNGDNDSIKVKALWVLCLALIFLVFWERLALFLPFDYYELAISRLVNVTEDGGSGRDRILLSGLEYWSRLDLFSMIFGEGFKAYSRSVGMAGSMHNDFAELSLSYGVVGLSFLFFLYIRIFFIVSQLFIKSGSDLSFSLALAAAFLVYSNVAGVYFYSGFFVSIIVGYAYLESIRN